MVIQKNNQHLLLLYDDAKNRDSYIFDYINAGLDKNELCVYGTVSLRDKNTAEISSKIVNYEKNIKEHNLLVVDMAPFYIGALTYDLSLFQKFRNDINRQVKTRINTHVRFVGDCASFLFENKHFPQCVSVESWWHQRPFEGIYLCPYQKSLIKEIPYFYLEKVIKKQHDIIINTEYRLDDGFTKINKLLETDDTDEINEGGLNF
jgi:hypothetical protein